LGFEVIKEIIHVEKEGCDMMDKAKAGALKTEQESLKTAEEIICQAEAKARADYEGVLKAYEEEAKKEEILLIEENQQAKGDILNIMPERLDKAVNLVIERIVSGVGNS
jgi:vacuolar-type H+-ATPase subunit H